MQTWRSSKRLLLNEKKTNTYKLLITLNVVSTGWMLECIMNQLYTKVFFSWKYDPSGYILIMLYTVTDPGLFCSYLLKSCAALFIKAICLTIGGDINNALVWLLTRQSPGNQINWTENTTRTRNSLSLMFTFFDFWSGESHPGTHLANQHDINFF